MTVKTKKKIGSRKRKPAAAPREITLDGVEYILVPKDEYYGTDAELVRRTDDILNRERHRAEPLESVVRELFGDDL